jgi:spore photoproduct lyase
VLAKGANTSARRRALAEDICAVYPAAEVIEAFDTPHNGVPLDERDPLGRLRRGKQTLVLGEHKSAVRRSTEESNACPNYWHFSVYGFCPYDCDYCYLAGTRGVWFSPTVKIFMNLEEILNKVALIADRIGRPTAFYLGKLQDGLALDPLTGYSRSLVPFFAQHPHARMTLLTKASDVANLLDLQHDGGSTLSWSVSPPEIAATYERRCPPVADRITAMRQCARAGYPVRAVVMPIIPVPNREDIYQRFLVDLLRQVSLSRITLGTICSYPQALRLTELKLGTDNPISVTLAQSSSVCRDGRSRFPREFRQRIYRRLIDTIRQVDSELEIGLCLEEPSMFGSVALPGGAGRCNCLL